MKWLLFPACIFLCLTRLKAQDYPKEIQAWQQHYKEEFLADPRSPVKVADTVFLRFYEADKTYRISCTFLPARDARPFDIATHSGKTKPYRLYGTLRFRLKGKAYTLEAYQGMDLLRQEAYKDYLFVPFTDLTNNETTYGGGRYIDLKTGDITNGKVVLDFNKAYNPYCAFGDGFSCPIPPDANKLKTRIEAGERQYAKPTAE